MKRFLVIAIAAASVGFIAVGAASAADPVTPTPGAATYVANDAANGIADSRHNLGNLGEHITTVTNNGVSGSSEICVFCHTPHHSNTGLSNVPIWNRLNATTYTAYGTTLGGTPIANGDIGSTSLACLSCHDGVTTFDNIANRPGKDVGAFVGATFWDKDAVVSNKMTSGRLNIGTALNNDHPVSVTYWSDGRASLRQPTTDISSISVSDGLASSVTTFDGGNLTKNLWAVKGFINSSAKISDLLRGGKVECASCHDPHFNNKSWNEVDSTYGSAAQEFESNGLFLRRVGGNSGSGVCRTCHNK